MPDGVRPVRIGALIARSVPISATSICLRGSPGIKIPRHGRAHFPSHAGELLPRLFFTQCIELSLESVEPPDRDRIFRSAISVPSDRTAEYAVAIRRLDALKGKLNTLGEKEARSNSPAWLGKRARPWRGNFIRANLANKWRSH